MIHFREILSNLDVQPLLTQLNEHPELWNTDDSWTANKEGSAIYNSDNIVLRFNRSSRQGLNDWDKPAFHLLSAAQKLIWEVMRAIPGEHLGKVIITRLKPGETIEPHIDRMPPGVPAYFQRYQIPLSVKPGVWFKCGDEEIYMKPGSSYWFDNQVMHSVVNSSDDDRISMLTDIRPFRMDVG